VRGKASRSPSPSDTAGVTVCCTERLDAKIDAIRECIQNFRFTTQPKVRSKNFADVSMNRVAVLGPAASGKKTLARSILKCCKPDMVSSETAPRFGGTMLFCGKCGWHHWRAVFVAFVGCCAAVTHQSPWIWTQNITLQKYAHLVLG
jgi:hypothetical protein